jgi:hypothetical protein
MASQVVFFAVIGPGLHDGRAHQVHGIQPLVDESHLALDLPSFQNALIILYE